MNTDIKILNQQDEIVAILSLDDSSGSLPYWNDKIKEKLNDPYSSLEFEAPADHEAAEFMQVENKVAIQNKEGKTVLFRIKDAEDRSSGEIKTRWIFAESEALDLLNHWTRPQTFTGTAAAMLNAILYGSQWETGTVEFTGDRTHIVDNFKSAIEVINEIRSIYASDLFYRVEITGSRITGRYVDFLTRRGEDAGRRFEFEKNLTSITRRESTQELATALIGIGESLDGGGFTTFANVTWSIANGDPADKPAGQDWIGDPEALQRWGYNGRHVMRTFRDDNEENPEILLSKTWEDLQKRKTPAVTFEMDILLLERLAGYEAGEKANLGDTIRPLDHSFNPPVLLEARIIEMEWSLSDPSGDQVVLGDYRPRLSRQYAIIQDLQNTIQVNRGTWDAATRIYSSPTAPANPEDGTFWQDTSTEAPHYIYSWNATAGAWVPTGATQASDLGAVDEAAAKTIAQGEAKTYVDANAEPAIHEGTTAPTDTSRKWLDTSASPAILKAYINNAWVKAAPTTAAEVGADPAGAASQAEQNAKDYAEPEMHIGTTAPADTTRKWLDTSGSIYILKVYDTATSTWKKATPTTAGEVGAETTIYKQTTAPAHAAGRLWLDTSVTPNVLKRSTGTAWVNATPTSAADVGADPAGSAATAETNAKNASDPKGSAAAAQQAAIDYAEPEMHVGTTAPTDTTRKWLDTTNSLYILKVYSGTAWVKATPTTAAEVGAETPAGAQTKANTAETNAKNYAEPTIFKQTTAPAHAAGRLWLDTSKTPNILKRSTGSAWVDATPTTAAHVGADPAGSAAQAKTDAIAYAEKKIYRGSATPTGAAANDLWIDETDPAKPVYKKYNGSTWTQVTNWDLAKFAGAVGTNQIADNAVTNNKIDFIDAAIITVGSLTGITVDVTNAGMTADAPLYIEAVRMWAGATWTNRETAPFRVLQNGKVIASNIDISGGSINVGTDAKVGNNLYLGDPASVDYKYLYFNNSTKVYSDGVTLFVEAGKFNLSGAGQARIFTDGGTVYIDGSFMEVMQNTYFGKDVEVFGKIWVDGQLQMNGTEPISTVQETGFCGVGGMTTGSTSSTSGVGVNFRTKKNYTPSSISLAQTANNLVQTTHVYAIDISANGFWLYINGGSTTNTYRYWRGFYTA